MGYVKIWIHLVWTTYKHQPVLTKDIRKEIFVHIKENANQKGIYVDHIGGYTDHVHCLLSLNGDQCISKIAQMLKGESTYWANKKKLIKEKLKWQEEYFAVSVGDSYVQNVRNYIRNQEEHHKVKSFNEEYEEFLRLFGIKRFWG
ncbi:MAG: IS200/IS605 family transposase [Bacteroidota bacterium]